MAKKIYSPILCFIISILFSAVTAVQAETLFSLSYGEYNQTDSQIEMSIPPVLPEDAPVDSGVPAGPFWFYVDKAHDIFYIADDIYAIKKFTMTGEFLAKIQLNVGGIRSFSIDNEENIYIIHGNSSELLSKADKTGQIIWTKSISDIMPKHSGFGMFRSYFYVAQNGFFYLELSRSQDSIFIKLDTEGSFIENAPSNYLDRNENYYLFKPVSSSGNLFIRDERETGSYTSGFNIDILDQNKTQIKTLTIAYPDEYKNFNNLRSDLEQIVDPEGNIYVLNFVARDTDKQTLYENGLVIDSDNIIYKFSPTGNFLSKIQFPSEPIMNLEKRFQVDNEGNLYYLSFQVDKLDVVKVPPTIPFQQFSLKHWSIHWDQGKHDKNKFQISGRIDLPDDYTLDMLQKKGIVTIAIEKNDGAPFSQTAALDFKQKGPIWQYKAPKAQNGTEPFDIEKMLIFWQPEGSEGKLGSQGQGKHKRAGWFMIQGNINIPDTDQAALLPKAALTFNIPVENITTAGALESTEEVEFKVQKNLWIYNAAPHSRWQDWQESWWEKVKED